MAAVSLLERPMRARPLDVAIAIIGQEGQYLITQRLPADSFGGFWEFPGGKLNEGETFESCLIREIQEELGIKISVNSKLLVSEYAYPGRVIRLHCFLCTLLSGEPKTLECAQWRWVASHELGKFQFPPASGTIIQALQEKKSGAP